MIITIDGPAASGKSSVAKLLAERLKIAFVSSGQLYRAVTYLVLESSTPFDEQEILAMLGGYELGLEPIPDLPNKITVNGRDISTELNTDEIDANVSKVAIFPKVREWVDERLKAIRGSFVIEGRDMGAKVFKNADYKFYLTASPQLRAKRRLAERLKGFSELVISIIERDKRDYRQLKPAEDAIFIDTEQLNLDEVVEKLYQRISGGKDS